MPPSRCVSCPIRRRRTLTDPSSTPVSVGFVSLGCAKNLVDSQVMAGTLLAEGLVLAPTTEEADVVIVNTCAFIDEAREEAVENILAACELKRTGPCRAVLVTGCMTQRYQAELKAELPEVDGFIGLDELDRVGAVARRILEGEHDVMEVSKVSRRLFESDGTQVVFSTGPYTYLKIAEGCNHRCSFCAIPSIRGRRRSRRPAKIVREAEHLLERGFPELVLIAQDTTSYGSDLEDGTDLAALLCALGAIGGRFWIRVLYGYPSRLTDALLEAMGTVPQVCAYLDVPVQHSHPDILRAMKRGGTADAVAKLGDQVRRALPGVTLRTTCLVGFPGEREKHAGHLLDYVERTRFDHLGAFVFSPEEHTAAFDLASRPSHKTAERRRERLLEVQRRIVDEKLTALAGTKDEVLLQRPQGETWLARARRQAPDVDGVTIVSGVPAGKQPGDFVTVRYTCASDYDICAEAIR